MFPTTDSSESIVSALSEAAEAAGVVVLTRHRVAAIDVVDDGEAEGSERFALRVAHGDGEEVVRCRSVLLASGGTRDGHKLAERLGLQGGVVSDARTLLEEDGGGASMEEVLSDLALIVSLPAACSVQQASGLEAPTPLVKWRRSQVRTSCLNAARAHCLPPLASDRTPETWMASQL